ncbi:MAG: DUF4440 domain-containing protein [Gammaproteobacteria bacterium]|nr:DUF4440 domain-containing protein [Gammaproteobacteria bacterium]
MSKSLNSIDNIVKEFFRSFDNRENRVPNYDLFANCFVEGCVIGNRTDSGVSIWSIEEFWQPREELLINGRLTEFHEWETESDTSIFNGIACRQSTYQKEGVLDGVPFTGGGTKMFQLVLTQDAWRVVYLLWEDRE